MWPKLVLLDRDGVINADSPDYILSPQAWQPLPGSLEAIARLSGADIPVVICTNQSAVGRGWLSEATLTAIHEKLNNAVTDAGGTIAGIDYCPHSPEVGCECRKPAPGLIKMALKRHDLAPSAALFIGDSRRDLQAAERAGVPAWLVRTGNGLTTEASLPDDTPVRVFDDLSAAVSALLIHGESAR